MKQLCVILAAPVLLAAAPKVDEQTRTDLRCYLVLSSLARSGGEKGDVELAKHANAAASFFLGRVQARAPQLDLEQAMIAEAAEHGDKPIADFVPGCLDIRMRALENAIKPETPSSR